jgi:uncharacterized membrane protein
VNVILQYDPPAGKLGAGIAALLGMSPGSVLREDLRRLKVLLESDGRSDPSEQAHVTDWLIG